MNELITKEDKNIENMIYEIRGKQVMLDSDLGILYGCVNGAKTINQAVKRHLDRFPSDFYFQLTKEEYQNILRARNNLKSQAGTSSWNTYGGVRKLPYVFTEQGVSMLSSVLRTENAAIVSINIMRAFVAMKHYIMNNSLIYRSLDNINNKLDNHEIKLLEHDKKFDKVFSKFDKKEKTEYIFYNGSLYEAYSKIVDIMNEAKKELIIIDGYADKKVLDMIKDIKVNVTLICKENMKLKPLDIEKYNEQYDNLKVVYNDTFHDRYLIIDKRVIYHLGSSLNNAGKRTFGINKLEEKELKIALLNKINTII